jgi:hypothetical protein
LGSGTMGKKIVAYPSFYAVLPLMFHNTSTSE